MVAPASPPRPLCRARRVTLSQWRGRSRAASAALQMAGPVRWLAAALYSGGKGQKDRVSSPTIGLHIRFTWRLSVVQRSAFLVKGPHALNRAAASITRPPLINKPVRGPVGQGRGVFDAGHRKSPVHRAAIQQQGQCTIRTHSSHAPPEASGGTTATNTPSPPTAAYSAG